MGKKGRNLVHGKSEFYTGTPKFEVSNPDDDSTSGEIKLSDRHGPCLNSRYLYTHHLITSEKFFSQ